MNEEITNSFNIIKCQCYITKNTSMTLNNIEIESGSLLQEIITILQPTTRKLKSTCVTDAKTKPKSKAKPKTKPKAKSKTKAQPEPKTKASIVPALPTEKW